MFVPPFRCERELAGVTQISQEMLDSSENGVQRRGFSRWPLSAFCVLQVPEGRVNGEEIVCLWEGGGGVLSVSQISAAVAVLVKDEMLTVMFT